MGKTKFVLSTALAASLTGMGLGPAWAVGPNITLSTSTPDIVAGTAAVISPSGNLGISGPDWSKFTYSITVPTGRPVNLTVSYRTKIEDVCVGATVSSGSNYRFCSFEYKSSNFVFRAGALSSEVSGSTVSITVTEDASAELIVRAWVDSDSDKRIDGYEMYSQNLTIRNYGISQLPLLLDFQFEPPVWGEKFVASVGSKRSPDRRLFSERIVDLSKFYLSASQSEDFPFVEPSRRLGVSPTPVQLFNAQTAYFENSGTDRLVSGQATSMTIALLDTSNLPINTSLNGTYVKAELQLLDAGTGGYLTALGAPFDSLETNSQGQLTFTVSPSIDVLGSGRLVMRYMSFDNTQIAINYLPIAFIQRGVDDNNPSWRRTILSAGKAQSHQGLYELSLYYRPFGQKSYLVARETFDYQAFNVGEVSTGLVRGSFPLMSTSDYMTVDSKAEVFELEPAEKSFDYLLTARDVNGKPGEGWPVYLRVNFQDTTLDQVSIDGVVMSVKEELLLYRKTDSKGQVLLDVDLPSTYQGKAGQNIRIDPQVFGMKDVLIPRLDKTLTLVTWKEDKTRYFSGNWSSIGNQGTELNLTLTATDAQGVGLQLPVIVKAESPITFYTNSGQTASNGRLTIAANLSTKALGKGKSKIFASVLDQGEIKQLAWEVDWDSQGAKMTAKLLPHVHAKPEQVVIKQLTNQQVKFEFHRLHSASDYLIRIVSLQPCPAEAEPARLILAVDGASLVGAPVTSLSKDQDAVIQLTKVDLSKLRVSGAIGSCLVRGNTTFELLATDTSKNSHDSNFTSNSAVTISSFDSKVSVKLVNQSGNQVSIRIGNKWYRYSPISNSATWSIALTPRRTVTVDVYINRELQASKTLIVAPNQATVSDASQKKNMSQPLSL